MPSESEDRIALKDPSQRPRGPTRLRWLIAGVVGVTILPALAVLVVLPFAGKVALAFQHGSDAFNGTRPVAAAELSLYSLSSSKVTPNGPTATAKVTGGGTLYVGQQNPSISFGFVAQGLACDAKGNVNYVNHINGAHINGPVTCIDSVTFFAPDDRGRTRGTVTFSGQDRHDGCPYTVKVTDNGEPGTTDRFGLMGCGEDTGAAGVDDSQLRSGNIQLHPTQASQAP